jgi:hypothetical protein
MNMEMEMMMYHQRLYTLHNKLSRQHHEMAQIQMEIANLNFNMYMHMMNQMNGEEHNCRNEYMRY